MMMTLTHPSLTILEMKQEVALQSMKDYNELLLG